MAIDFSSVEGSPAKSGKIDFSSVGGTPAADQAEPEDTTTTLGAAGRGAVGMLPLGEQGYAATVAATENKPYLKARQELDQEIAADKENHPVARVAGQTAGVVAPALLTGGASAPESLAAAAGEGAALGGGFGAGNAIDTLAKGGSNTQAAIDVGLGAATGAAGGAAGSKLGGLFSKGASTLEDTALEKSLEAMHISPKVLGNMTPEKYLESQSMVNQLGLAKAGTPADMLGKAQTALDGFGAKIGAVGDQADAMGLTLKDPSVVARPIGDKMADLTGMSDPDAVAAMNKYKAGYATLQALSNKYPSGIPWDELQRLKSGYGNIAFKSGEVASQPAADVYFALKDGMQSIADSAQANPDLGQDLKDSLKGYNLLSPIVDGLKSRVGAARAGQEGGGLGSMIVGGAMLPSRTFMGARIIARGAGSIPAETVAKGATAAAGTLSGIANALPAAGAQTAAAATPPVPVQQNISKTMPINSQSSSGTPPTAPAKVQATGPNLDHPALAAWKPVFQRNAVHAQDAGEVEKANAVTDFTLSQRDPAYAAAKQKAADDPAEDAQEPEKMADGGTVLARSTAPPGDSFNTDMADKLKKFIMAQKEKRNGQPR